MYGIQIKSGVNNCYWNVEGKCTNSEITRNEVPLNLFSRDWDSIQNCTFTILSAHICGCYKPDKA